MIRTKICGITRLEDATACVEAEADAIGFNFYKKSKRYIEPALAAEISQTLPTTFAKVGVFVNAGAEEIMMTVSLARLSHVQLHGDEDPDLIGQLSRFVSPETQLIRAVRVIDNDLKAAQKEIATWEDAGADLILLDAASAGSFGGTGKRLDWKALTSLSFRTRWLLAGGLNPEVVSEAIESAKPDGVDVASGVEDSPGVKNKMLIQKFVQRSRF